MMSEQMMIALGIGITVLACLVGYILGRKSLSEKVTILEVEQGHLMSQLSEKSTQQEEGLEKISASLASKHQAEMSLESIQAKLQASQEQSENLDLRLSQTKSELDQQRLKYAEETQVHIKVKTEMDEQVKNLIEQKRQFEEQKKSLSEEFGKEFKLLANEVLENKTKAMQETNKLSLNAIMNPFQQSIDGFKKEVNDIHSRETAQRGELKKELENLKELNQKITTEAHELSTALRGQKKLQGNWGELVLENVLDRSGLQLGKDYKREVSITTEDGRQRPDVVIYLPQDKHLIIDAKVSLNAYTRYINGEDEEVRKIALLEHVKAMGDRIKELADRDYYKLPGLNSPEMVFMFVPIESAFVEALKADETLFQSAIENNVLVATPTTLLTSLNIVRQLWRYEDQNKHTVALAQKAEGVFKKLNTFLASFENIKKSLQKATDSYSSAENQLLHGKGNLVKQVSEFKKLAPAIKAELPSYFLEKSDLEIDLITHDELQGKDLFNDEPSK
ncbi:MAG: DNA recombination protein RmuC [Candidatus Azotimanducaceae bacterium]|jgi:DNA recombination protein RmuC